ncbi:GspMb/PilO family protein [Gemmatimonas sp.]|uniref:GspMb/PilO family protein n=1 Tax=Gemmatimonas sp. TaxID=1962908 RepID=UPI00286CCAE7|nr:GspMb/PilO family protein [Gemmatimonas sp.]
MTIAPALSRERRVVIGGILVLALSLLVTYGAVPAVTRWREREIQLDRARKQVAHLKSLQLHASELEAAAAFAEGRLAGGARRVIHARSSALGASALQTLLQGAADASGLVVDRVDVSPDLTSEGDLTATLSAYGDIHGLAALLAQLTSAPRITAVERLTVQINPALRGAPDVLRVTLGVRAPMVME